VTSPPAIDIHAHFYPEAFLKVIEDEGAAFGVRVDRSNPKGPAVATGDAAGPPLDATYWDLDRRVRAMDKAGVRLHALSLTAPMVYFADGPTGTRLARAVNDAMDAAHTAFPGRFVGCATLPMQDPTAAVACPLAAGGATIHHPGVLHHTAPNDSDDPRVAWILQFREEGSWGVRAMVPGPVWRIVRRRRGAVNRSVVVVGRLVFSEHEW